MTDSTVWTGRIVVRFLGTDIEKDFDQKKTTSAQFVDLRPLIVDGGPLHYRLAAPRVNDSMLSVIDNGTVRFDAYVFPPTQDHREPVIINMTRDTGECAGTCLNRLGLHLAKRMKSNTKKTRGDHRTAPVCTASIGPEGDSTVDASALSNMEFWSKGLSQPLSLQLTINDINIILHAEVNPPTILGVSTFEKFESSIFPGVPIHVQVETLFASSAIVDWYADGERVCQNSALYTPTSSDVNKKFAVTITPVRPDHDGQGCQEGYQFKKRVAMSRPTNTVLDIRQYWQQPREPSGALRVMSFNILADQNAFSGPARTCFFPWCDANIIDRSRRMPLILHEILAYQADVICLQEVDQIVYDTLLEPVLQHFNYQGFHSVKQSPGNQEGCAMFWSLRKFQRVSHEDMRSFRLGDLLAQYTSSLSSNSDWKVCAEAVTEIFQRRPDLLDVVQNKLGHVFQLAHLKTLDASAPLLISNTHLFFHPKGPHIRLMQLFAIAHQLDQERAADSNAPFLLCGDFNTSLANCGLLLMNRHVPMNHRDYRECFNSFRWEADRTKKGAGLEITSDYDFPEMNLPESFPSLATAYPDYPQFTHYIVGFSATLDHILMTTKTNLGELKPLRQAEMPTVEQVTKEVAMPSASFPSDHIAVVADLEWITS